jgi:hypothetical protein
MSFPPIELIGAKHMWNKKKEGKPPKKIKEWEKRAPFRFEFLSSFCFLALKTSFLN